MEESTELPCADKLALDTKEKAEAAATVAEYQHDTRLTPYLCQDCGLWHLKTDY